MKRRVYFLRDERSGLVKIGCSSRLSVRVRDLARLHPRARLSVVGSVPGGMSLERALHSALCSSRAHMRKRDREWFSPDVTVMRVAAAAETGDTLAVIMAAGLGSVLPLRGIVRESETRERWLWRPMRWSFDLPFGRMRLFA